MCRLEATESCGTKRLTTHVRDCFTQLLFLSTNASISQLVSTSATPVDPMRAKVPITSAGVKPEDFLKGSMRQTFCNQQFLVLSVEPPGCPRRCHMISQTHEVILRDRLLRSGGAAVFPIVAGWFAVDHSVGADRLILDRRLANHWERHVKWLELPLGFMLSRLC